MSTENQTTVERDLVTKRLDEQRAHVADAMALVGVVIESITDAQWDEQTTLKVAYRMLDKAYAGLDPVTLLDPAETEVAS